MTLARRETDVKIYPDWKTCVAEVSILKRVRHGPNIGFVFSEGASWAGGATARLYPPNCVPLVSFVESPAWLSGQTEGFEQRVNAILSQLTEALTHVHTLGFAHLSLGGDSVRVQKRRGSSCLVRLFDFESCRPLGDVVERGFVPSESSAAFSCPELVAGEPFVARVADAWSFGIVSFFLATSSCPFPRDRCAEAHSEFFRATKDCAASAYLAASRAGLYPAWPWLDELLDKTLLPDGEARVSFV